MIVDEARKTLLRKPLYLQRRLELLKYILKIMSLTRSIIKFDFKKNLKVYIFASLLLLTSSTSWTVPQNGESQSAL